ncbi:MAG: hypothetical protein II516_03620, partial [Treponema sp.]|nr:hypothetical protein [Treponema sp.]
DNNYTKKFFQLSGILLLFPRKDTSVLNSDYLYNSSFMFEILDKSKRTLPPALATLFRIYFE